MQHSRVHLRMREEALLTIKLSKTTFVRGNRCLKWLYLHVHKPELAAEPEGAIGAIIEQGRDVGLLARHLFPGGVEIPSDTHRDEAIRATRELVANANVPAIFEGVFEHQNVLVRVELSKRTTQVTFDPASAVIAYEGKGGKGEFRPRVEEDALEYEWENTTPPSVFAKPRRAIRFEDDEHPRAHSTKEMSEIIVRCAVLEPVSDD